MPKKSVLKKDTRKIMKILNDMSDSDSRDELSSDNSDYSSDTPDFLKKKNYNKKILNNSNNSNSGFKTILIGIMMGILFVGTGLKAK